MLQKERLIEIYDDLRHIYDEMQQGYIDDDAVQDAVNCQMMINRIVFEVNEDRNKRMSKKDIEDDTWYEGEWISVKERLPMEGNKVLCYCQAGIYEVLRYVHNEWVHDHNHVYIKGFVKAWTPLPEPCKAYLLSEDGENYDV